MDNIEIKRTHFDMWLLILVVILVGFGVTMVYSSTAVLAAERFSDSYYYLKRTIIFSLIGFGLMTVCLKVPYRTYSRYAYPILLLAFLMVLSVFIPGLGATIGGARRWIRIGSIAFQPSELAKVAFIIFMAYSLAKKKEKIASFTIGFVPHLIIMTALSCAIFIQRDFGSAAIITLLTWFMLFAAGARLYYLFGMAFAVIPIAYLFMLGEGYRQKRLYAFLNPWNDRFGSGFQIIQSLVAFNEGGWFGVGLGEGRQKLFYLPEAHTDFIFSVIGEELGIIGVLFVIILFALLVSRGLRIALNAPDLFGRHLATGCVLIIALSAVLNMGIVMGILPTKGMTLPFISYGGSSLVVSLLIAGILLNISSYKKVTDLRVTDPRVTDSRTDI